MKNIKNLFKINPATYILILSFLLTGYIKNIIIIYLIVIFHELGHIFIIKYLGYKIKRVDIYPMGAVTSVEKKLNSKISHDLVIAIFGALFQIILGFIFYFLLKFSLIRISTYNLFLTYNKTILIFNLLPIIPLDGYQLLRAINELFFSFKKSFIISFIISIIAILLFITYNSLFSLNNYLIISFLIYKMLLVLKRFRFENLKFLLERYLNDFSFSKIKYENSLNLDKLKKNTYHYFKIGKEVVSEKKILAKKFDKHS